MLNGFSGRHFVPQRSILHIFVGEVIRKTFAGSTPQACETMKP
jgi:hypothetical protein